MLSPLPRPVIVLLALLLPLGGMSAADAPAPRDAAQLIATFCAGCHGAVLTGGAGPSLVDSFWNHGDDDENIARSIRDGWALSRMPPFGRTLTEPEIAGLVAYIHQQGREFAAGRIKLPTLPPNQTITS